LDQHRPTARTVLNLVAGAVGNAARDTVFTWNVTSSGAVSGVTTVTATSRTARPP